MCYINVLLIIMLILIIIIIIIIHMMWCDTCDFLKLTHVERWAFFSVCSGRTFRALFRWRLMTEVCTVQMRLWNGWTQHSTWTGLTHAHVKLATASGHRTTAAVAFRRNYTQVTSSCNIVNYFTDVRLQLQCKHYAEQDLQALLKATG